MPRLRYIPLMFLMLALALHCTQMCVAAGFAHASSPDTHASAMEAHDAPCHSADSPIPDPSEECASCSEHAFLKAASPVTELQVAAETLHSLFPVWSSAQPFSQHFSFVHAGRQQRVRYPLPLYLVLSVLRC